MKNKIIYFLIACTYSICGNAQIFEDDFESYSLGDMGNQNPELWITFSGVNNDGSNIIVSDDYTFNGAKSGYIGPDSVQDCLLLLGDRIDGAYSLSFQMFIENGGTAYMSFQGQLATPPNGNGVWNSGNLYFNEQGADPGIFEDETTGETATYPEEEWFEVEFNFDVDALTYKISVDGVTVHQNPVPFQADVVLGAIHFFSIDSDSNFWIDDILFDNGPPLFSINEFEWYNFKLYPNPVTNLLFIESAAVIDEIEVYDVLGNVLLEMTPNAVSPSIEMSTLSSGVYLVKVTIGTASKTFKIMK